jgi:hypothetical protein
MSITTRDLARLASILRRLDSDFPGERAAAGLLASRWMHERGLAWEDLIQVPCPAPSPPPAAPAPAAGTKVRSGPPDRAAQAFVHSAGVAGVFVLVAAAATATSARDLLLPLGALAAYVALWRGVSKFLPRWPRRGL